MFGDLERVVADTWRQLLPQERAPYEAVAHQVPRPAFLWPQNRSVECGAST